MAGARLKSGSSPPSLRAGAPERPKPRRAPEEAERRWAELERASAAAAPAPQAAPSPPSRPFVLDDVTELLAARAHASRATRAPAAAAADTSPAAAAPSLAFGWDDVEASMARGRTAGCYVAALASHAAAPPAAHRAQPSAAT